MLSRPGAWCRITSWLLALGASLPAWVTIQAQPARRPVLPAIASPAVRGIVRTAPPTTTMAPLYAISSLAPWRATPDATPTPIVVPAKGSEVVVIRIPVPGSVRLDAAMTLRAVQYRVLSGRHVQLLGAPQGALAATGDSALVLAVRVSRRAPAGRSLGGSVEFSIGTLTATVPFEIDVATNRQLTLAMSARTLLATRGRWNSVPLRVANAGNVEEIASVSVGVPRGWRADVRAQHRTQRLAAGATSEYQVRLWIPPQENAGMQLLPIRLVRPGERDTTEQLQVDVMADLSAEQRGARLTTSVLGGRTADGLTTTAYGVTLDGQLSDSSSISGRFAYADANAMGDSRGLLLARSGLLSGPPSLEVRHPRAHIQAGASTVSVAELGGQTLSGIGGAVNLTGTRFSLKGYELRPLALGTPGLAAAFGRGSMRGAEVGMRVGALRTAVFTSALREEFTARTLTAHGVRLGIGQSGLTQLSTEVGLRDASGVRGIGAATILQHSGHRSFVEVRMVHAPGGSRAFARAANEVGMSGSRAIGERGYLAVGGWHQADDNAAMGAIKNSGWSMNPSINLSRIGTLGLEARGAQFSSTIEGNRLRSDEISGGGMWSTDVFGSAFIARSSLARIDRRFAGASQQTRSEQWRVDHTLSLIRGNAHGMVQANWTYQQFSAPGGALPAQQSAQIRLERYRPRLSAPVYFDGEVQRLQLGQRGSAYWAARASATLETRMGLNITVAAERTPFAVMGPAASPRSFGYTLRVDRTLGAPRLFSGSRNRVFRDDNGNGAMDRGERGVPGIVIQCGARRVQTDASGRYACPEREQRVDARTVPSGLVASAAAIAFGEPVALRVMQPVRIELRVSGSDSLGLHANTFDGVVVYARDTTGVHWYARSVGAGVYVIDAMHVGRYAIGVDASALAEPLTMVGTEPTIDVNGQPRSAPVVLELRARPVKIRTFNSTSPVPAVTPKTTPVRPLRRAPRSMREAQPKAPADSHAAALRSGSDAVPARSNGAGPQNANGRIGQANFNGGRHAQR